MLKHTKTYRQIASLALVVLILFPLAAKVTHSIGKMGVHHHAHQHDGISLESKVDACLICDFQFVHVVSNDAFILPALEVSHHSYQCSTTSSVEQAPRLYFSLRAPPSLV